MRTVRYGLIAMLSLLPLTGCGTAKEKSAPCKRPAELTSFALDPRLDCGPARPVNTDGAQAAINALAFHQE